MKKFLFLLIPIILIGGCEKDFNSVVDNEISNYQVTGVSSFNISQYFPGDSSLTLFVRIQSFVNVSRVYFNIFSSEAKQLNSSPIDLYDDGNTSAHADFTAGDGTFSNRFPLSQSYPIGNYIVEYFVTGNDGKTSKAAVQQFVYDNGQTNVAPVISDLIAPDTIKLLILW